MKMNGSLSRHKYLYNTHKKCLIFRDSNTDMMAKRAQARVKQLHAIDCLIIQFFCFVLMDLLNLFFVVFCISIKQNKFKLIILKNDLICKQEFSHIII